MATVLAAVLGLVLTLLASAPASATNVRVRHSFFGTHDSSDLSYSRIHEGAVRLWSVGVQWNDIETSRGHYSWARLDQLVSAAQQAHAEVTMVVAMTPRWYASKDTNPPGTLKPYKAFVKALMRRYRSFHGSRGVAAYQVWNEVNINTYWTGTLTKLAALTKAMHDVRNNVDPHAKVIGAPMVTRLKYELDTMQRFYHLRYGGRPVWRYVDAIALSLYPEAKYGRRTGVPEDAIRLLHVARHRLHRAGVPGSKAIWNSEINYGMESGGSGIPPRISAARQAANVIRTYLLNAAAGVRRVFWFRYDWPPISNQPNTFLSDPTDASQVTAAGRAYLRVQKWMHGTLIGPRRSVRPCQHNRHGTYTCVVRDASGTRHIYWNPFRTGSVRVPRGAHHRQGSLGAVSSVTPGQTIKVGYAPVMLHR
jgi:hypothetical protein